MLIVSDHCTCILHLEFSKARVLDFSLEWIGEPGLVSWSQAVVVAVIMCQWRGSVERQQMDQHKYIIILQVINQLTNQP